MHLSSSNYDPLLMNPKTTYWLQFSHHRLHQNDQPAGTTLSPLLNAGILRLAEGQKCREESIAIRN